MRRSLFLVFVPLLAWPSLAANPRETPVVLAVRKAAPAVVNVAVEIERESPFTGLDPFFDRFFRDFFGELPESRRRSSSLGSGVLIDAEGHVLTNQHVVQNATRISVTTGDGATFDARLVGADEQTDLAVLAVETKKKLPYLKMGRSDDLMIGETVIAIGNPFGLSHTVTTGVVSAVNRTIRGGDGRTYADFIQTDASINPGNSGGPLLNIDGNLIGINAAIYQSAEGIGFAIPVDKARRIVADLIHYGEVHRAWIGIQVQEVGADIAEHYGLERPEGVLVRRVFEGGPAAAARVKRGDLVTELDGRRVRSRGDYLDKLAGYTAQSAIRLTLRSADGAERKATLTAREVPDDYADTLARDWLGVTVKKNDEKLARRYEAATTRGLMVTEVLKGGAAAEAGLKAGDILRSVNGEAVDDRKAFSRALLDASHRETLALVVQRGRVAYSITLTP